MSCRHKIQCKFYLSIASHVHIFVFFSSADVVLLNLVHSLMICGIKNVAPMLIGAIFAYTSEV
jgi:hypothetical protein